MRTQFLLKDIMRREQMEEERRERQLEKIADENGKKQREQLFGMHNYNEKMAVRDRQQQEIRVLTDADRLDEQER
jgi:hypothetical protein